MSTRANMIAHSKLAISGEVSGNASLKAWTRALAMTAPIVRNPLRTLPAVVESQANEFGGALALISERECLTYRELAEQSNRYARWALAQGLGAGDVVCLLMSNCAEYLAIWVGITRIGAVVSLVNSNLTDEALAHSINLVHPKQIIVAAEFADVIAAIRSWLPAGVQIHAHGGGSHGFARIDHEVARYARDCLEKTEYHAPALDDLALYIYTSGTTGLPKAAKVSHFRLMQWSHWFAGMMDLGPSDRLYNCLPLYHSIGGVVAMGAPLVAGASVVIRRRFSASRFWDDVVDWDCTVFQYIGELCRYLVQRPLHSLETAHRIRLCCGNGLRPEVWDQFKRRFRIPQILEYYAATEANFSLYNCEGRPGAIGKIPGFLAHRFSVALIRIDAETATPVRNDEGFCIRCCVNEIGEAVGQIVDDVRRPVGRFEGYTDKEASERKVLRNVFVEGDAWYRTGDLMRRDEDGYFYFIDRLGDTFRWKGENVSTGEVAETISSCPGVIDALVYGVPIPGTEGRAGMAAVVVGREFDLVAFRRHVAERVPDYARPLFLRICSEFETTTTFKPRKQDLARQGYDPALTTDPIYFNDRMGDSFAKIDAALYDRIRSGNVRL
jgi:fatty-acyl-CoA synthase